MTKSRQCTPSAYQYCAWYGCGKCLCEMDENGLVVKVDEKGGGAFSTHILKRQFGWCFEIHFRYCNLDNKTPYTSTCVFKDM